MEDFDERYKTHTENETKEKQIVWKKTDKNRTLVLRVEIVHGGKKWVE